MSEGWAKIKAAFDELSKMVAEYDCTAMGESEEDSEEDGMEADSEGMGSESASPMFPAASKKNEKVDKVSIASAIIKKKMGL